MPRPNLYETIPNQRVYHLHLNKEESKMQPKQLNINIIVYNGSI